MKTSNRGVQKKAKTWRLTPKGEEAVDRLVPQECKYIRVPAFGVAAARMREIRLWLGQFDDRKLEQILRANVAGIMGPNNRVAARLEGEKAGDYEFSGREDAIEQLVSLGFSHSYSPGQLEARASEELRLQRLYTGGTEGDQGPSAGSS